MIYRVIDFLNSIGIRAAMYQGADGFLPLVEIDGGSLRIDPHAHVSDVLHEAGHLAVIPERFRHTVGGDIDMAIRAMFGALECEGCQIDSRLMRAALQSGEAEATAWGWAAGMQLGLPPWEIVRSQDYDGDGDSVRFQLEMRMHLGIHGLSHAGLCYIHEYPAMLTWAQTAGNDHGDSFSPHQTPHSLCITPTKHS